MYQLNHLALMSRNQTTRDVLAVLQCNNIQQFNKFRYNGKVCASTTRYNDLTKGACGCGSEPNPKSYWTKSGYTAAANAMLMDPSNPNLGWCPKDCGMCFRLCSTGGNTSGKSTTAGKCIVV